MCAVPPPHLPSARAENCCALQASLNPKAETVEELQGRRKHLRMGLMGRARQDLAVALQAARDEDSRVVHAPRAHACARLLSVVVAVASALRLHLSRLAASTVRPLGLVGHLDASRV